MFVSFIPDFHALNFIRYLPMMCTFVNPYQYFCVNLSRKAKSIHLLHIVPPSSLHRPRRFILPLPYPGRGHYLQFLPRRKLLLELDIHLLLQLPECIRLLDVSQDMFHQRVQDVQAVDFVPPRYGEVEAH